MKLSIVTASTNLERAAPCLQSWQEYCLEGPDLYVVLNGKLPASTKAVAESLGLRAVTMLVAADYLGTVKAFKVGTDQALLEGADIVACLHDDLLIQEQGWDQKVIGHFEKHPACGLLGFGGAVGLGDSDIYQKPYAPQQLARIGFRSNMQDAELHGIRSTLAEKVACLDSFSMIFRKELAAITWKWMDDHAVVHHFHDGIAGCLAARHRWDTWYLPVACHHLGGRTAVGDQGYQAWAKQQNGVGDQEFWRRSHEIGYNEFRDVLPLRV